MKTLNRTLSLALVFALVFSLMSFAFADTTTTTTTTAATKLADFTDSSKVTYTEAADYLISAGVVKGDTATTLNPQGDLTREQAAKLIAYACLGQTAADNLKASVAPFTDIAADRWSAGYIAYCQKQGIINGYGDGTFGPTAKVTGYQYAKMLLCSIGYGVNGEFTGAGWDLEVAKLSLAYGIFTGNTTGASSNAANREQAFLYTFNTLSKLCNVSYNKSLGIYYVPGRAALETNPTSEKLMASPYVTGSDYRTDTVGAVKFDMKRVPGQTGDYGEAAHYWQRDGKKATAKYPDSGVKLLASSTDGSLYADLINSSNSKYIGYSHDTTVKTFYNGDEFVIGTGSANTAASNVCAIGDNILWGSMTAGGELYTTKVANTSGTINLTLAATATDNFTVPAFDGVRGVVVSFYDTDNNGKFDTVNFVQDKITKVTADAKAVVSGSDTLVTVNGIPGLSEKKSDVVTGYEGLKKDDYVTFHTNLAGEYTITKCGTVSGTLMAYNATAAIALITGTQYHVSSLKSTAGTAATSTFNGNYTGLLNVAGSTFYTDKGGNLVAYVAGAAAANLSNTVYVIGAEKIGYTYQAKMLDSKGAVVYANINKIDDYAVSAVAATSGNTNGYFTASTTKPFNQFYTYTKGTDGTYNLTTVTVGTYQVVSGYDATTDVVFAKNAANFFYANTTTPSGKLGTSSTVFVVESNTPGTYKAYTGISSNPKVTANTTGTYGAVLYNTDGYAIFAVAVGGVVDTSTSKNDYIFASAPATTFKEDAGNYFGYTNSAVNGTIASVTYATNQTSVVAGKLQAIASYDGARVSATAALDARLIPMEYNVKSFRVNGTALSTYTDADATTLQNSYVVSSTCKFFTYDITDATNPTLKAVDADTIAALSGKAYAVQGLMASTTDSSLEEVFVTITNSAVAVADGKVTVAPGTTSPVTGAGGTATSSLSIATAKGAAYTCTSAGTDTIKFTCTGGYLGLSVATVTMSGTTVTGVTHAGLFGADIVPADGTSTLYAVTYYKVPFLPVTEYVYVTVT